MRTSAIRAEALCGLGGGWNMRPIWKSEATLLAQFRDRNLAHFSDHGCRFRSVGISSALKKTLVACIKNGPRSGPIFRARNQDHFSGKESRPFFGPGIGTIFRARNRDHFPGQESGPFFGPGFRTIFRAKISTRKMGHVYKNKHVSHFSG